MQLVTIIDKKRHKDGTTTVLVQLNKVSDIDEADAPGTNAVHELQSDDVRGQLLDLYPDAELHTVDSLNEKITTHLIKLGKRVYDAQGALVSPAGPVKKAAIKANLAKQGEGITRSLMLSSPSVDAAPEL